MRHVLEAVDVPELVQRLNLGGEPAVQAEDLILDFCCDWQALENVSEHLPDEVRPVLPQALVVKPVELVDLPVLVVAPQDGDARPVLDLEEQDVEEGLHAVEPPVHVVAHEEVVGVGQLAADLKNLQQIEELAVGVSADGHWRTHVDQVGLLAEDLLGLLADGLDLTLGDDAQAFEGGEVFVDVLHIENVMKQKIAFYFNSGSKQQSGGAKVSTDSCNGKGQRV